MFTMDRKERKAAKPQVEKPQKPETASVYGFFSEDSGQKKPSVDQTDPIDAIDSDT